MRVPGWLFELGDDVTKHPDSLCGAREDFGVDFRLDHRFSVGASFFHMEADGNGEWQRNDSEERMGGVTGVAEGRTDWRLTGFAAELEWRPVGDSHRLYPYLRGGGGVGFLRVEFRGSFSGVDGDGDSFTEPASDCVSRTIPIIAAEAGLRLKIVRYCKWFAAGYWNTGYGLRTGIQFTF